MSRKSSTSRLNQSSLIDTYRFHIAYTQVAPGDVYTMPVPLGSNSNDYGNAYAKPVGVLNNGHCYSACDLFSANMQDTGAAIIFGEDGATGAGGANVVEHNDYLVRADKTSFQPLPYADNLKKTGAPNFRVGWRQQIRNGKNAGKLIEDYGVVPNFIVRPHVTDLLPNATRLSQYDRIARILRREGARTQRNFVYCKTFCDELVTSIEFHANSQC
jgi:hypothetical protein